MKPYEIQKYEISLIDGKEYCRKNGKFFKHLQSHGHDYESYYDTFIDRPHYCPHCENKRKFVQSKMCYRPTCGSVECTAKQSSITKSKWDKERWEQQRQSYNATMSKKDATEKEETAKRRRCTNKKRYGYDHPWKSPEIRKRIGDTIESKYGSRNYSSSLIKSDLRNFVENPLWLKEQNHEYKKPLSQIASEIGVSDVFLGKKFREYDIPVQIYNQSWMEEDFFKMLQEIVPADCIIRHDRKILGNGRELDFVIPSENLAIEFCGIYWHTERTPRVGKNYHKQKVDICNKHNIQLLTIFDDEWLNSRKLVQRLVRHKLNRSISKPIGARNTTLRLCSHNEAKDFLNRHHIQGLGNGSIKIGLYHQNCLVAVAQFQSRGDDMHLNRFATSTTIQGGFSKILKFVVKTYQFDRIVTFADRRWSNGKLYDLTGFKKVDDIDPDYYYVHNGKRYHKSNYRRKMLPKKLKQFDSTKSERLNCMENGIYRLWDCGKIKYEYKSKN